MFSPKADVSKKDHLLTASLPFRKCGLNHTNIICSVILNLRAQGARENEFVGSSCVFLWQWSLISKRIALIFFIFVSFMFWSLRNWKVEIVKVAFKRKLWSGCVSPPIKPLCIVLIYITHYFLFLWSHSMCKMRDESSNLILKMSHFSWLERLNLPVLPVFFKVIFNINALWCISLSIQRSIYVVSFEH